MSVESEHQRRVLEALARQGPRSTVGIARATGLGLCASANAAAMLILRGYATRSATSEYSATREGRECLADGGKLRSGPVRPRGRMRVSRDTLRQRAWTAMRLHQRFTIADLVTLAARSGDRQPHAALQRYLSSLCAGGYAVRLPGRMPGMAPSSPGAMVYRLIRDTGERAPTISRQGELVERNADPAETTGEADAGMAAEVAS